MQPTNNVKKHEEVIRLPGQNICKCHIELYTNYARSNAVNNLNALVVYTVLQAYYSKCHESAMYSMS